jgi:hypothetical protein
MSATAPGLDRLPTVGETLERGGGLPYQGAAGSTPASIHIPTSGGSALVSQAPVLARVTRLSHAGSMNSPSGTASSKPAQFALILYAERSGDAEVSATVAAPNA